MLLENLHMMMEEVECPHCGKPNCADCDSYCTNCGKLLRNCCISDDCKASGHELEPEDCFCPECGGETAFLLHGLVETKAFLEEE